VGLSKIMQGIQFSYTQRYNRRHRMVGHLFRGRHKAILCDRDASLLELVRYIHLNPARMKHPQDPWQIAGAVIGHTSEQTVGKNSDRRCAEAVRV
jgi:putative transposase